LQKISEMILYNTTFIVDEKLENEWFSWFKTIHIQDYMQTNCFIGARLGKITSHTEPGAVSYSMQLFVKDELTLEQFKNNFLSEIQQKSLLEYGTSVLSFTSEMDHLGDFS